METPDAYVLRIKQVVRLLGYEDPQVIEVFKNTVPNRLYWVLFPINNLHEAVETAKRFLTKEKIDRQMTGQSTTPFMKLTDKKRKTVTFDKKDALERTSENMEWMTALMDKMYIKLDQKEVPYKPQIYQRRDRGQNRQSLDKVITGEEIDHLVEAAIIIIEDMEEVEVIFGEVIFKVGLVIISEEMIVEIEEIEGHGGSLNQEKEEGEPGQNQILDPVQELAWTEIEFDVLKCRKYNHFANECQNLVPKDSDRDSDGTRSASLQISADSDTGSDMEQYLNIWKVGMAPPHFCL